MTATEGLRKRRTGFFVQVPRATIRDKRLSFKARGLLTYLLDMPEGWDVRSESLANEAPDGRDAIRSGLKELAEHGYYRLERRRLTDGRMVMGTSISEVPVQSWVADSAEYDHKAVTVIQQSDGSFKVRHKDGTLTDDGFEDAAVDDDPTPPGGGNGSGGRSDDEPSTVPVADGSTTGAGFSGAGPSGAGSADSGLSDAGESGAFRENPSTGEPTRETPSSSEAADAATDAGELGRDDVERLCKHLADRVEANGSRRPIITAKWRQAARLLLDRDGRTEDQVHRAIDWCQDDEFWRANVLSMPKLREQYDTLRLRAQAAVKAAAPRRYSDQQWDGVPVQQHTDEDLDAIFGPAAGGGA